MAAKLRSEWIKLFSTRTTWTMIGIGLLGEALFAGLFVGLASLNDIGNIDEIGTGVGLILVLMLVLGVLLITTEFRHGTSSSTFLASPRRYPVLLAKLALIVGVLVGLAFTVVNGGLAQTLGSLQSNPEDDGLGQLAGGLVFAAWSFGLAAIGTLLICKRDVSE